MIAPIWSDEIIATAREAFDRGCSFTLIAREIAEHHGVIFSRNAVIGKAGRLGWTRLLTKAPTISPRRATKEKPRGDARKKNPAFDALPFVPRAAEATPLHLKLFDLKSTSCRWPYGDTDFTFCGCEIAPDSSYCPAHKALSIRLRA